MLGHTTRVSCLASLSECPETALTDLDHFSVLEVVGHREQSSAEKALANLPVQQRAQLEVVALDMWPALINAARTQAPNTDLVHDRFHVMKHLNEAVYKVLEQEHAELSKAALDWPTGLKYLFLKSPSSWKAEEKICFKELRNKDLKVTKALDVKENSQHF